MSPVKLSIIIPTYTITQELELVAYTALQSYRDQVDEIIIAEDGGMFSPLLFEHADTYIHHQNQGFVRNVNQAWRLAQGEYVAIVNSDTFLKDGNLEDLCNPTKITCPVTVGQDVPFLAGHFFVVPRRLGVALFDERLHMFCSDADIERRFWDRIIQVPSVEIYHEINKTLNTANLLTDENLDRDRKVYAEICQELVS